MPSSTLDVSGIWMYPFFPRQTSKVVFANVAKAIAIFIV